MLLSNVQKKLIDPIFPATLEAMRQQADLMQACLEKLEQIKTLAIRKDYSRIYLIASGYSWHSALVGKYVLEQLALIPTEVCFASEYQDVGLPILANSLTVVVNSSPEATEILQTVQEKKLDVLVLTSQSHHHLPANSVLQLPSGFIPETLFFFLFALNFVKARSTLATAQQEQIRGDLQAIPELMASHLQVQEDAARTLADEWGQLPHCIVFGRGINYPVALEGARLLTQTGFLHAQGYPAGEFHHGPKAIISEGLPIIAIAPPNSFVYSQVYKNAIDMQALGATIFGVTPPNAKKAFTSILPIPNVSEWQSPFLSLIPLQFLAYYLNRLKGG